MKSIGNIFSLIICTFFFSALGYSQGGSINIGTIGNRHTIRHRAIIMSPNAFDAPFIRESGRFTQLPQRMNHEARRFSSSNPLSSVTSLRQLRQLREHQERIRR